MHDGNDPTMEERILLLAPTKRDAAAAGGLFARTGITPTLCDDIGGICSEVGRGAAVAIVPDEAILKDRDGCIARLLREQPPWSDLPLIVLTHLEQTPAAARELEAVGHMMLVRRPVEIRSLLSTIRAGLRDRRRQYALRRDLAERERQAEALRENDRHRNEFLAMLAHELRNPLAAVKNAVRVLKCSDDEAGRTWAGEVVERQVEQLVRLIDDLLEVSRITTGKIRLQREYLDAGTVIDHAIEAARPLIDERRHSLTVSVERGDLPIHADATRIGQIILNLLTNAAKYTGEGGNLRLSARKVDGWVSIGVRDDGMGIPPEKLPEMFRLFTQGDRSLARSEGGLGIGLTVVQRLAEMHGGTVEARSDGLGRGSEFVVRLPLARRPATAGATPREIQPAVVRGSRILVVDDNVDTALGMARLLKILGNEVLAVHDGPAAIESAHAFRPDFVLLDIGLPGMDGYQVASALRGEEAGKDAVIIAISGYGQDEDRRRSRAAGVDHHLVKPVDFDSLLLLMAGTE